MTTEKTETKTTSAPKSNLENLTADEKKMRSSAEAKIRNGLKAYHKVGEALTVIAQNRLYRNTHTTMAKYAREVWDMTTARVSQYQHAYRVHELLAINEFKTMPKSESQCRPFIRIPADENQDAKIVAAWRLCVLQAPLKITAKMVSDAVDSVLGIEPKEAKSEQAEGSAGAEAKSGSASDQPSASAEMRAEMRQLKRKIAYLESVLAAEKAAHIRTQKAGAIPTSKLAKQLFKAGFRAMAKKVHPDHGGNAADFEALTELKATLLP